MKKILFIPESKSILESVRVFHKLRFYVNANLKSLKSILCLQLMVFMRCTFSVRNSKETINNDKNPISYLVQTNRTSKPFHIHISPSEFFVPKNYVH